MTASKKTDTKRSEAKFTPGPWFMIHGGPNLAPHLVLHRERPGDATSQPLRVADVHCADYSGFSTSETGIANARLIAQAPAMYESLKRALEMMPSTWAGCARKGDWKGPGGERYASDDECPCHMHDERRTIVAILAAIEGKS